MKHPSSFYFFRRIALAMAIMSASVLQAIPGQAQVLFANKPLKSVKSVSFNTAYLQLNPGSSLATTKIKSSVNVSVEVVKEAFYTKQFTVFYGVPTTVAADWLVMRYVVSGGVDDGDYWSMTEAQRNAADALLYDPFVPPSAYASMRVGLDFRFAAPRPIRLENSGFYNNGPVQGRKFFFIR
ncbi:MAG: hypothetical protein V4714_11130 [Bacteroidota bacterium]